MRFSLFLIFSVLFSISASAREQELWIWKKVFNIFTKEPVLNAKVDLLSEDSTLIATSFSNVIINGKKCAAMFILKKPGKYIFHASHSDYEDVYESFEIEKFYKKERSITLRKPLYMQRKYPKQRSLDKVQQLKDVIVRGQLVQMKTDRIIYHVDADSSAMKEKLIETLRKMPGLIVSRKGEISADDNRKIVYKLNGLRDPLVNNPIELLSALNSKYVKKVELVTHPDLQYGNDAVVLNITTKGRLEGYMLTMYGKGTDSSLFGSIWGTSKIKRIRFSGCYSFNDMFGHSSTSRSEELRHEVLVDHMSITEGKIGGTSSKDHNMELSASYDVDDHSLLSAYARIFLRNNMHSSSRYDVQVTQADNSPSYSYVKQLNHRLKSPEYQASLNYERVFGPGGEGGKFFVGYNYYGRPYMEKKEICYQDLDSVAGCANSISGLMDCLLMTSSGEDWHTCELEYNRRVGKHHLFVFGLKGLLRLDHDDNEEKYSPIGLGYYRDNTGVSLCKRTQNFLQSSLGYTYNDRKWRISAGLQCENDWEKLARADKGYTYKVSFCDFLPSMGISYILSDRGTLSLGYAMSVSRPNIFALDPYVDSSTVNELSYGNPGLKPQRNQDISLTAAFRMGSGDAWYLSMSLAHQYSDRLLLGYSYLAGSVLHTTKDNIGHKNNTNLELSLRKRFGGFFFRTVTSLAYVQYSAQRIGQWHKGWFGRLRCMAEYELPKDYYLELEGNYHTKYVMLQGYGSEGYEYGLSLTKKVLGNRLTLMASAYSFLPIHYRWTSSTESKGYHYKGAGRNYQASFVISARYNLGHLKSRVKQTQKQIVNDDVKTDYTR